MSEKTAKQQRKEQQPDVMYRMVITITKNEDGKTGILVEGIPGDLDTALNITYDANRQIVKYFARAIIEGDAKKAEPSRIVPAYTLPKELQ